MKITFTYTNGKEYSCEMSESICQKAAAKAGYKRPDGLPDTSEAYLAQWFISTLKQAASTQIIDGAVKAAKEQAKGEIDAIEAVTLRAIDAGKMEAINKTI